MVVLGKANLSEWANIRDGNSTSGWSAYGGLTRNPYALNRSAGGSSSGQRRRGRRPASRRTPSAPRPTARSPARRRSTAASGSSRRSASCPPTASCRSRASQDSPGPMATTVRDAAALLGVLAGNGTDYASHAVDGRLAGKRIGVPRATYWGYSSHADERAERAVALLAAEGATIVDDTDLASHGGLRRGTTSCW